MFYLEESGHADPETKQYIPTDFSALKVKSELPDEERVAGKFIFDNYLVPNKTRDLTKYATCVVFKLYLKMSWLLLVLLLRKMPNN